VIIAGTKESDYEKYGNHRLPILFGDGLRLLIEVIGPTTNIFGHSLLLAATPVDGEKKYLPNQAINEGILVNRSQPISIAALNEIEHRSIYRLRIKPSFK
jgi:hypothetical protein